MSAKKSILKSLLKPFMKFFFFQKQFHSNRHADILVNFKIRTSSVFEESHISLFLGLYILEFTLVVVSWGRLEDNFDQEVQE